MTIPRIQGLVCQRCGIPLKEGGQLCFRCRETPPALLIRAATEYRGVMPSAIYRFKYAGRKTLAHPFGTLLHHAWEHSPEIQDTQAIVPIPLYSKNERVRGFNQAELLAKQLAELIQRPILPMLIRMRKTASQIALNREKRGLNVRSAFDLHPYVRPRMETLQKCSFLLIDDVCTTASTLNECANVLRKAGARRVKALVLARDL